MADIVIIGGSIMASRIVFSGPELAAVPAMRAQAGAAPFRSKAAPTVFKVARTAAAEPR